MPVMQQPSSEFELIKLINWWNPNKHINIYSKITLVSNLVDSQNIIKFMGSL